MGVQGRNTERKWLAGLGVAIAVAWIAVGTGLAVAGKPPASQVDGGKIYYHTSVSGALYPYVMAPDGTGKASAQAGAPSLALHGGKRWFLSLVTDSSVAAYPSGWSHLALLLVNESGGGVELALSDLLEPTRPWQEVGLDFAVRDGVTDGKISFGAKEWVTEDPASGLEGYGLYVLAIDWDEILAHATSTPYPTITPTELGFAPVGELFAFTTDPYEDNISLGYSWSDDGNSLVSDNDGGPTGIYRLDLDSEGNWSDAEKLCGDRTTGLDWHGSYVLYSQSDTSIRKISAAGYTSSPTAVVTAGRSQWVWNPRWSPNGTHFTYQVLTVNKGGSPQTSDVYVAAADGSGKTNLTGDVSAFAYPCFWRGEESK